MNKASPENNSHETFNAMQLEDILLKMISYEAGLKMRVNLLLDIIEKSLENGNKDQFIAATDELNSINQYLNS